MTSFPLLHGLLPSLVAAAIVVLVFSLALFALTRGLRALTGSSPASGRRHLERFVRRIVQTVAVITLFLIAMQAAGIGAPRLTWSRIAAFALGRGLRIAVILAGAGILVRVAWFLIAQFQSALLAVDSPPTEAAERRKRVDTVGRLLRAVTAVVVLGVAGLMALRQVDVDITPILTGAGVLGVAVGFGAQTLVKDIISGLFLILENQIRLGDIVTINGKTGLVESIRLRIVVLRGGDGAVYIFQNGNIAELANLTKDFSYATLDLNLGYAADLTRALQALGAAGDELSHDAAMGPKLLGRLEILGIESLAGGFMTVRARVKTLPSEQWIVARELRRRVKLQLDLAKIALA